MKKALDLKGTYTPAGVIEMLLEKEGLCLSGQFDDVMGCALDSAEGLSKALSERLTGGEDSIAESLGHTLCNQIDFLDTIFHAVLYEVNRLENEIKALKGEKA